MIGISRNGTATIKTTVNRLFSLRGRGSKGKGKGLGHETTRKGGGEPLQGSHCFCHPAY